MAVKDSGAAKIANAFNTCRKHSYPSHNRASDLISYVIQAKLDTPRLQGIVVGSDVGACSTMESSTHTAG